MNSSTSSMDVYKVSEDGGSFRLPCLNESPGKWMLDQQYTHERPIFRDSCDLVRDRLDVKEIVAKDSIV